MTHLCVGKLTTIGPDNGLSPVRRQAIIWTNAGISLIGPLGTNFSEILIAIHTFSFKKMHPKLSSAKWRPFFLGLNVLMLNHTKSNLPMLKSSHVNILVIWDMRHGLPLTTLTFFVIGWSKYSLGFSLPQWIVESRGPWEFPHFPEVLPLGLCNEAVKKSNLRLNLLSCCKQSLPAATSCAAYFRYKIEPGDSLVHVFIYLYPSALSHCFWDNSNTEVIGKSEQCFKSIYSLGPVSLRFMTSQFKDIVNYAPQKFKLVKCIFCNVWVPNFAWIFEGCLWDYTQNFETIHRKIHILQGVKSLANYDLLELWHLK